MATTTHYDNLRVAHNAPIEVIKASYRALAQMYHPDRSKDPNAARNMQIINDAYAVLSVPAERKKHDAAIAAQGSSSGFDSVTVTRLKMQNQELTATLNLLVTKYGKQTASHRDELARIDRIHQAALEAAKVQAKTNIKAKFNVWVARTMCAAFTSLVFGFALGVFIISHVK